MTQLNFLNIRGNIISGLPDLTGLADLSFFDVSFNMIPQEDIDLNTSVITINEGQNIITNVEELIFEEYSIYPNPVIENRLNIDLGDSPRGDYKLQILSIDGEVVLEQQPGSNVSQNVWSVDLPQMKQGIYIIQLYEARGALRSGRMIIK
ncbi:MAG: T9SS type A sorting domain-containing protein [Bacteroidota bacterium]